MAKNLIHSSNKYLLYYLHKKGLLLKSLRTITEIDSVDIKSMVSLLKRIKMRAPDIFVIEYCSNFFRTKQIVNYISKKFKIPSILVCNPRIYKSQLPTLKLLFGSGLTDVITTKIKENELKDIIITTLEIWHSLKTSNKLPRF